MLEDAARDWLAARHIELTLIDTEAHKAIDVFYVTCDGRKPTRDEAVTPPGKRCWPSAGPAVAWNACNSGLDVAGSAM